MHVRTLTPVAPDEKPDGSDNPDGRARSRRVEVIVENVDPADVGSYRFCLC